MKLVCTTAALALSLTLALVAQTAQQKSGPEFEVASIRPTPPDAPNQVTIGIHIDGSQVRINYQTVQELMRLAWRVKPYQIAGPDYTNDQRFDVSAKLPDGSKADQVPDMLKNLLIDRFKIAVHTESRDLPVYALTLGKGGMKMKEYAPGPGDAAPDAPADAAPKAALNVNAQGSEKGVYIDYGGGSSLSFVPEKFEGHKVSFDRVADALSRFMDRPVVNMTGLTGLYDFSLAFSREDYQLMLIRSAIAAGVKLPPQALSLAQGQPDSFYEGLASLGLKLESKKAPQEMLIVDHAEKMPAEN
jgi:uncharacterized protein (TIGR03435 family)